MQLPHHELKCKRIYSLHHQRSQKSFVDVVPDDITGLYRICWPDIGLSAPANLSRCIAAALEWAERSFLTDHCNLSVVRRLKSLDNFKWSSSPVRESAAAVIHRDTCAEKRRQRSHSEEIVS